MRIVAIFNLATNQIVVTYTKIVALTSYIATKKNIVAITYYHALYCNGWQ
jgi:hypothetical protein